MPCRRMHGVLPLFRKNLALGEAAPDDTVAFLVQFSIAAG